MVRLSPTTIQSEGGNINNLDETTRLVPPQGHFARQKPQAVAAFIVTIGAVGLGTVLGWSSPVLPKLETGKEFGEMTVQMKSWLASIVNLGTLASGLATGFGMDRVGRKLTLVLFSIPFWLGWVLLVCSQNFTMLLIGRFVTGFCGGVWIAVVPVYIAEFAEDGIRGMLSSVMVVGLTIGILFAYVMGSLITWRWLSIICSLFPLLCLGSILWMGIPESPRYLLAKSEKEKAVGSLKWFRGAASLEKVEAELTKIQGSIDESSAHSAPRWKDYLCRPILKPILICLILMFFQQFGGINAVIFYSMTIFKAAGIGVDPSLATMIIGFTQVLIVLISTFLVDKAGRKLLLIISGTGMSMSLIALGVFFTIKEQHDGTSPGSLGWLPLTSLVGFIISYNLGLASIPWVMMGELLPQRVKAFACPLVTSFSSALGFIITKNFEVFTRWIGTSTVFYIFGFISGIGIIFSCLVVPETKGKSLDEIQTLFKTK